MSLRTQRTVFIHVPRTGGTWVQEALADAKCFRQFGRKQLEHLSWTDFVYSGSFDRWKRRVPFGFVRNPITWYQSTWAYCTGKKRRFSYPVPSPHIGETFRDFVLRVTKDNPGALGFTYKYFLQGVRYIGRFERLRRDLVAILKAIGEPIEPFSVLGKPIRNNAPTEWKAKGTYDKETLNAVIRSERHIMKKYRYGVPHLLLVDVGYKDG